MEDVVGAVESGLPLLSVVIPVRNGMPFIREAVSSILRETDIPIEVIVRENSSTDGTVDWLNTVSDERVRVVIAPEPVSAAENWTAVCELARGEYIKIVCADDFLCDGGLQRQYYAAISQPDAVLVASRRKIVTETGQTLFHRRGLRGIRGVHAGAWVLRKVARSGGNPFGEPASVIFRSDALKTALPFSPEFPYVTDLDMYVRVLKRGRFVGLRSVDAAFRVNSSSWSSEIGAQQLDQYRRWLRSRQSDGSLPEFRFGRFMTEIRILSTFLARRAVTRALGLVRRT